MWGGGGYLLLLRQSLLLKHAMPSMLQSASTSTSSDSSSSTSLTAGAIAISASVAAVPSQKASIIGHIHPTTTAQPVEAAQPVEEAMMSVGTSTQTADFPEAPIPELCCGSGCPNCIYIQYAEDVLNYVKTLPLHDGIVDKQKKLIHDELKKNVQDDNLRMFLQMEIDAKGF